LTTTAYDLHFIASDIAFTDENGTVHLNIPFRKVKRIENVVIGMAGCLSCMIDYCQMLINFLENDSKLHFPQSIIDRETSDFIAILYINGACLKLEKLRNAKLSIHNITQVPTVIGSGGGYVQEILNDCPNAVVAVLEAMKHDRYTDGEVKYCSIRREDIHNLEVSAMSTPKLQVLGLQQELESVNEFLTNKDNQGKSFSASTEVFYHGEPSPISIEVGMAMIQEGFENIKKKLSDSVG
jgi:hypothetical protein